MAQMVRKQVYVERRQEERLKALAKALRVTEAELIRQGIDRGLEGMSVARPDGAAWREAEAFIQARARKASVAGKRRWRREELHDR
jgi:hypothetical protein